jgi:hypothetical protein
LEPNGKEIINHTKQRREVPYFHAKIVYAMYIYLIVWGKAHYHYNFDPPIFDRENVNQNMGSKGVTWKPIPNNSLLAGLPSSSFHILWANCH